jgi:hypothetical protein
MSQTPVPCKILGGAILVVIGSFSVLGGIFAFSIYLDDHKRKNEDIVDSLFVAKYKSYKSKI